MSDVHDAQTAGDVARVGDGWGPSRSVRSSSRGGPSEASRVRSASRANRVGAESGGLPSRQPDGAARRRQPASGRASHPMRPGKVGSATAVSTSASVTGYRNAFRGIGMVAWKGLVVLAVITAVGALIDAVRGQQLAGGFNIGCIIGSIVAILLVRRSSMFPIVVAPPIFYSVGAGVYLYLRSGGLHNHSVLFDAAPNLLVYGFPAVAAATAAVLIIAGFRLIARR